MSRTITDNELDIVVRLAARRYMKREIERLENMDTSKMPETPGFDKKVRAAIRRDARKEKLKKVWKPVGHVAKTVGLVIIVGIVALFTTAMAIRPLRTAVWDAVVEWYEEYIVIHSSGSAENPQTIEEIHFPTYVPEGWSITVEAKSNAGIRYTLSDGEDRTIYVEQAVNGSSNEVSIDNTEVELTEILLNEQYPAQLAVYEDGMIILIWENTYRFGIISFGCGQDLVLQIAESIN